MELICTTKQKCRTLLTAPNFEKNYFRFGLLIIAVFIATINVLPLNAIECGTINLYHEAILGGNETKKAEWPFIAALYYLDTSQYFCGGTILTHIHVLTAAHCIQNKGKGKPHTPDEITIHLGAYNLTDRGENNLVVRNVSKIFVHPDWNHTDDKYDADIAILVLNANLTFSNYIRPVCMPQADFLIDGIVGTVVGWGKTENGTAEGIPRKIEINALNDTYCYAADKGIARYVSERSFCGGGRGSPRDGDSGGGFFAVAGSGWVQFGVVSFIRPKETENNMKFAGYTKLTSFRDWIAQRVEQSGGNISLATTKTNLNCRYQFVSALYGCFVGDLNVRQENFVVENITGSHASDKGNDDVDGIYFRTGVMVSLPRNFGKIFTNLRILTVVGDTRRVSRSDFAYLERLQSICFFNSSMTKFDENSLWDLPQLQLFILVNSKLELLHGTMFSKNHQLRSVNVSSNAMLRSLPGNLFENNLLLDLVSFDNNAIEFIDDDVFLTNTKLRDVFLKGNRLRHLSENLFRNNFELTLVRVTENHIKTMDEQCFQANSKLKLLRFDSNELESLPEHLLHGLEFLERIYVNKNSLKAINEQFFETNLRLKKIFLQSNKLTHIPANLFRNNGRLEVVRLDNNYIDAIDGNLFSGNPLLLSVSLGNNFLFALPWNLFRHNAVLKHVYVQENSLERIDEHIFEWNTRLLFVDFTFNLLTFLPEKLFHNNSLLEGIIFNSNSLVAIYEKIFENNAKLQRVSLNRNDFNHLPENLFRNNPLLKHVEVMKISRKASQLQSLPRNLFQANPNLKSIDFGSNSLQFIGIDFTMLKRVKFINLSNNDCVDAVFLYGEAAACVKKHFIFSKITKNLTEFQELVTANCSQYTGKKIKSSHAHMRSYLCNIYGGSNCNVTKNFAFALWGE